MKLLVVGGAGYVGSFLRQALEAEHDCRYLDLKPVPEAAERSIVGDVNDDETLERALVDRDAVLYLAMGTINGDVRTCNQINPAFDVNVRGWYRLLYQALAKGVRRFCFASTLSVYNKYHGTDESMPPDSWYPYGFSKRLGEYICEAAVQACPEASVLALRLILPRNETDWPRYAFDADKERNTMALGPNDTRALFLAAIQFSQPGYHVVQASGDMKDEHLPNHKVRALLGWSPKNH